jgi:hypothetical protein
LNEWISVVVLYPEIVNRISKPSRFIPECRETIFSLKFEKKNIGQVCRGGLAVQVMDNSFEINITYLIQPVLFRPAGIKSGVKVIKITSRKIKELTTMEDRIHHYKSWGRSGEHKR